MMRRAAFFAATASLAWLAAPVAAQSLESGLKPLVGSQQPPVAPKAGAASDISLDSVTISGQGSVTGAGTFNAASGANNQQANVGIIASGQTALGFGSITQITESAADSGGQAARVALGPNAFAGSTGWIAVNGGAGANNQQANMAIMALGSESLVVSDLTLERTRSSREPMGENGATAETPSRFVALGDGAFKDSSGIVQLSLVGGDRNTTANTFALLVAGSAGN